MNTNTKPKAYTVSLPAQREDVKMANQSGIGKSQRNVGQLASGDVTVPLP